MTTMTLPANVTRVRPERAAGGSQLVPLLLALALLAATALISILITGPMH